MFGRKKEEIKPEPKLLKARSKVDVHFTDGTVVKVTIQAEKMLICSDTYWGDVYTNPEGCMNSKFDSFYQDLGHTGLTKNGIFYPQHRIDHAKIGPREYFYDNDDGWVVDSGS